jgi:hypothetical protein
MIELEYERVALAAVHARTSSEDRFEMREVACDRPGCIRPPRLLGRIGAAPASSSSGASPMAVDTDHFAATHLGLKSGEVDAGSNQRGD